MERNTKSVFDNPSYNPNGFVDALIEKLNLKNDAALSRSLEVAPPVISKIRHGRQPIRASLILFIHENFGIPVREIRALMGTHVTNGQGTLRRSPGRKRR